MAGDPIRLLRAANEKLRSYLDAGMPPKAAKVEVDIWIRNSTNDEVQSLAELRNLSEQSRKAGGAVTKEEAAWARSGEYNPVQDFLDSFVHGATFGWSDELAGILPGGRTREEQKQRIEDLRMIGASEEAKSVGVPGTKWVNPAMASELAGGVGVGLLGGSAAGAFRGGTTAAGEGVSLLTRAIHAGGRGAAVGAGSGALYGAGEGEGLPDRAKRGAVGGLAGGLLGGAIGAAMPPLAAGAGYLGRATQEAFAPTAASRRAGRNILGRAMDEAEIGIGELGEMLSQEPGSTPADLSPVLAREARAAVATSPRLSREGGPVTRMARRHAGRGPRLADELEDILGGKTLDAARREAVAAKEATAAQVYRPLEETFAETVPNSDQLLAYAADNPVIFNMVMKVAPDAFETGRLPFRAANLIDRALKSRRFADPIEQEVAREAKTVWRSLMSDVPGYDEATSQIAPMLERIEGMKIGEKAGNWSARKLREAIDAMSPAKLEGFRQGFLDSVEGRLRRNQGLTGVLNQTQEDMARFEAVIGNIDDFERFFNRAEIEGRWARTWNTVNQGSRTTPLGLDVVRDMPQSKSSLLNRILSTFFDSSAARVRARELVGEVLLKEGPEAAEALAAELSRKWYQVAGITAGRMVTSPVSLPSVAGRQTGSLFDLFGPENIGQ